VLLAHGAGRANGTRYTPYTVTAPGPLKAQLDGVRASGLAASREEYRLGELSSAAPVPTGGGTVAAVSVTSSTNVPYDRLAAAVREAAVVIGRALAARPHAPRL
jgi:DNA-binding IclR family transcriptional regulator